jgi:integrase
MRLSERFIQQTKPTPGRRRDFLASGRRGLILRIALVRGQPRRTFRYRYFSAGAMRMLTLGDYGANFTLADAHELHASCAAAVQRGEDPAAVVAAYWSERAAPPVSTDAGPTVRTVVEEFLKVAARQRKRPEQAKYLLEANVLPSLGARPVASLRKRDIVEMLDKIVARRRPVLANRVQALLKQAFAVAADRDLIDVVPIFPRAAAGGEEAVRTRTLTEAEIKKLWHGLDTLSSGKDPKILRPLALALKLQLVTAQRRGEIAEARWDAIADHTWCIPQSPKRGKRSENVPHFVPLSPLAQSVLDELGELAKDSDYWLPSYRTGKAATDRARSISKAAREARKALRMKNWRPHDLRRTARTFMAKLGVVEEVAERVLGHGHDDPMVATYNQYPYRVEMKDALDRWAVELARIVAGPGT